MRTTDVRELTFRIVLEDPPAGVDFGLQIGRGAEYETVQTQRSKGKDLSFEFSVGVGAAGDKTSAPPDFQGPVVQGPPSQRLLSRPKGTRAFNCATGSACLRRPPLLIQAIPTGAR